ncbi:MAG: hypothetical protein K2L59_06930 [Muribaculaceae bacterium]|nr:hypothetical protein [Muribaculaceae bacterium]
MEKRAGERRTRSEVIWGRVMGCALGVYILYGLYIYWYKLTFVIPEGINYWQFTEWLINYQGGFVRRGLIGDGLWRLCDMTGAGPRYIVSLVSLGLYGSLLYYFFRKFREKHLCWWLLGSTLMFGYVDYVIRKDFLLIWCYVACLLLLKEKDPAVWRRAGAGVLMVFCMFVHEAFLFFGVPLVMLLLADGRHRWLLVLTAAAVLGSFILMCVRHGSHETVVAINGSWNTLAGSEVHPYNPENAIGALDWETVPTFMLHLRRNTGYPYYFISMFIRPLAMFLAYYIVTFFLKAFRHPESRYDERDRANIAAVFILLTVCMLPMWTVLSCDNLRMFQYVATCTVGAFLVLGQDRIRTAFPSGYMNFAVRLNRWTESRLPVSRGWMLLLFLCWFDGPGWYGNDILDIGFEYSIFGRLSVLAGAALQSIMHWLV